MKYKIEWKQKKEKIVYIHICIHNLVTQKTMKLYLVLIFVFVAATDGVDVQSLPVCEPGFDYGKVNSGSCNSDQGVVFDPTECKALAHKLAKKATPI